MPWLHPGQTAQPPRAPAPAGRATSPAGRAALLAACLAVAGCAGPALQAARPAIRALSAGEMDRITVGDASATSDTSSQAIGAAAASTTLSSDISVAGGSPLSGAPIVNYAASRNQATARGAMTAQATGSGRIFVGTSGGSGAAASATAGATAAGSGAGATIDIRLYGISTANGTSVVFGTSRATACCAPLADALATIDTTLTGPHVQVQKTERQDLSAGTRSTTIDFAAVSSRLPLIDPSRLPVPMGVPLR